jgi:hypothetical protein
VISLHGGPADGVALVLKRAPLFLRVVYSEAKDDFDALDQLDDTPKSNETIYVYRRRAGAATYAFIDWHDGRGRKGARCAIAEYQFIEQQPGDAHTRGTNAWRRWCLDQNACVAHCPEGGNP